MKRILKCFALIFALTFILTTGVLPKTTQAATFSKKITLQINTPTGILIWGNKGKFDVSIYKTVGTSGTKTYVGSRTYCSSGVQIPLTISFNYNSTPASSTVVCTTYVKVTFYQTSETYECKIPMTYSNLKNYSKCTLTLKGYPFITSHAIKWS